MRKNERNLNPSEDCKCCMLICSPCLGLILCLEEFLKNCCLCLCKICFCDCDINNQKKITSLSQEVNNNNYEKNIVNTQENKI